MDFAIFGKMGLWANMFHVEHSQVIGRLVNFQKIWCEMRINHIGDVQWEN
jgi:hypothetical protein